MAANVQVTFDCDNPDRLARFWAEVLGTKIQEPPPGFATWQEFAQKNNIPPNHYSALVDPSKKLPRLLFQKVPEGKSAKNRMHLDVNITDRSLPQEQREQELKAKIGQLTQLGASLLYRMEEFGGYWYTLTDPEGNEFCLS